MQAVKKKPKALVFGDSGPDAPWRHTVLDDAAEAEATGVGQGGYVVTCIDCPEDRTCMHPYSSYVIPK